MNVATKNTAETGADRRAFGRRETEMPASVRTANHTYYDCVIRDISEGGALLEFLSQVQVSGRLWMNFKGPGQEIICEVRHIRGNRAGVQFVRNISMTARPIAAPVEASAQLPALRRHEAAAEKTRAAASELVAARRNAAKAKLVPVAMPELIAPLDPVEVVVEIPADEAAPVLREVPRDISGLLQSVAALAAGRAVPRPLPAREYALITALIG